MSHLGTSKNVLYCHVWRMMPTGGYWLQLSSCDILDLPQGEYEEIGMYLIASRSTFLLIRSRWVRVYSNPEDAPDIRLEMLSVHSQPSPRLSGCDLFSIARVINLNFYTTSQHQSFIYGGCGIINWNIITSYIWIVCRLKKNTLWAKAGGIDRMPHKLRLTTAPRLIR